MRLTFQPVHRRFAQLLAFTALTLPLLAAPAAFEIGPDNKDQLPRGKEADGIIGDFVLRNDKVEAVISANLPLRRANMSTFYGTNGISPGCLYDLTLRGAHNDQLTCFSPSGQQGPVSWVRVAKDGSDGEAVIETVVTSPNNGGLYKRHEYRLRDGWQGVSVVTTYRNAGVDKRKGTVDDRWTTFTSMGTAGDIAWADAVDPADKAGYARAWVERDGMKAPPTELELKPGQEISFARFVAVGTSPLQAVGVVREFRGEPTALVSLAAKDASGKPVTTARLVAPGIPGLATSNLPPAYADDQGLFSLRLPAVPQPVEVSDLGRDVAHQFITTVNPSYENRAPDAKLSPQSAIAFDIRGENGQSIPCKAQFIGVNGTKVPNLGPQNRAAGCVDQYHSANGQFRQPLPPGDYEVIVTRGIEFGHLRQTVKLAAGQTATVKGVLKRLVDTRGWVSADYHNHSTPSGDNTCGTDDRLINLAAEGVEFVPTTEHNRFYDWRPHIVRLGLTNHLQTVSGVELTGSGAHFNSFPFEPVPLTQDGGAPVWSTDPRITAATLRDFQKPEPARWIQINHPDMVANFTDRDGDGRADGGFIGLPLMIDGVETENYSMSSILSGVPFSMARDTKTGRDTVRSQREFVWLQLLNKGHRYVGVAVCDAHSVYGNGTGGWRMYMPSASDEPARIDWRENVRHAKEGRSYLTTGPFLQVQTGDGTLPGGTVRATGGVKLKVRVQCTDWIDIDRVQVLVNGRAEPKLNFTRATHPEWFANGVVKFDRVIDVPLAEDAHLIVVAAGENFDLKTGYGTSAQAKLKPIAYHNPIWADVDGGGFKPNGDTLGWPLTTKVTADEARALLEQHVKVTPKTAPVTTAEPKSKAKQK
ncbi:MAG: CehA/McbA family metallohydrolase [Verrucomicrobia bacterium]|nr:CehA/McbA family metallohydrolase [Verrucomicrobiota bacterium]